MKQSINFCEFTDQFKAIRPNNFSYNGLRALYDWLEEYEDSTGQEIELDVIALCCDFSEYTLSELQSEYGDYENEKWDDINEATDWLNERTIVIPIDDDSVIVQAF